MPNAMSAAFACRRSIPLAIRPSGAIRIPPLANASSSSCSERPLVFGSNFHRKAMKNRPSARALAQMGYRGPVGLEGWASGDDLVALERFREAFAQPSTSG